MCRRAMVRYRARHSREEVDEILAELVHSSHVGQPIPQSIWHHGTTCTNDGLQHDLDRIDVVVAPSRTKPR